MNRISILILLASILLPACNSQSAKQTRKKFEWETVPPHEQSLDKKYFQQLLADIEDSTIHSVDGLLIVRNGKIVLENYFNGFTKDSLHNTASVGKSITSALIGIAIDKGFIKDRQEKLYRYFSDQQDLSLTIEKQAIELQHVLTMTSGLACDDWDMHSPGNQVHFETAKDVRTFTLNLPMQNKPGERFAYCTGGANLLGEIIRRTSGENLKKFADKHLFNRIGAGKNEWFMVPQPPHFAFSGGGNSLTPRDMARFGLLYLNNGRWNGQQVVPENWVKASTQRQITTPDGEHYGYLWWVKSFKSGDKELPAYEASGYGGNKITVIPDLDMVIVLTGSSTGETAMYVEGEQAHKIMQDYIVAAVKN